MKDPEYARLLFDTHLRRSGLTSLRGLTVLELGPGDSLLTAEYAIEAGASHVWLIDAEPLAESGRLPPNASYLTSGLESMRTVPEGSVDFLFSHAVLEHVRLHEFQPMVAEMRRVVSPGGVCSHVVDFRDHLQNSLNNLRFSRRVWESRFMATSGFYTNRLTFPQMLRIFRESGLDVTSVVTKLWPAGLPLKQSSMAHPFDSLPTAELTVMEAELALVPAH